MSKNFRNVDGCYKQLMFAILKQAVDDCRKGEYRMNALNFVQGTYARDMCDVLELDYESVVNSCINSEYTGELIDPLNTKPKTRPREDVTGQKFGRLTALKEVEEKIRPNGKHYRQYLCKCDCGGTKVVQLVLLKSGQTKSCGCANGRKT